MCFSSLFFFSPPHVILKSLTALVLSFYLFVYFYSFYATTTNCERIFNTLPHHLFTFGVLIVITKQIPSVHKLVVFYLFASQQQRVHDSWAAHFMRSAEPMIRTNVETKTPPEQAAQHHGTHDSLTGQRRLMHSTDKVLNISRLLLTLFAGALPLRPAAMQSNRVKHL